MQLLVAYLNSFFKTITNLVNKFFSHFDQCDKFGRIGPEMYIRLKIYKWVKIVITLKVFC